jgi:hypothetical protein
MNARRVRSCRHLLTSVRKTHSTSGHQAEVVVSRPSKAVLLLSLGPLLSLDATDISSVKRENLSVISAKLSRAAMLLACKVKEKRSGREIKLVLLRHAFKIWSNYFTL